MAQEELRVLCLYPKAASGRLTSRAVDVETDDIAEVSVHGEGVVGVCNPLSNLVKKSEIQGNRRKKLPISKHRTAGAGIFAGNDYICDRMRQPRKKLRETPGNAVEKPMK